MREGSRVGKRKLLKGRRGAREGEDMDRREETERKKLDDRIDRKMNLLEGVSRQLFILFISLPSIPSSARIRPRLPQSLGHTHKKNRLPHRK